jgi:hypothetical protein
MGPKRWIAFSTGRVSTPCGCSMVLLPPSPSARAHAAGSAHHLPTYLHTHAGGPLRCRRRSGAYARGCPHHRDLAGMGTARSILCVRDGPGTIEGMTLSVRLALTLAPSIWPGVALPTANVLRCGLVHNGMRTPLSLSPSLLSGALQLPICLQPIPGVHCSPQKRDGHPGSTTILTHDTPSHILLPGKRERDRTGLKACSPLEET